MPRRRRHGLKPRLLLAGLVLRFVEQDVQLGQTPDPSAIQERGKSDSLRML